MKAHEKLSDESKWTKGYYAKDDKGRHILETHPDAVCWCAEGAINFVYGTDGALRSEAICKLEKVIPVQDGNWLARWNDAPERTFAEVRDLLLKLDI